MLAHSDLAARSILVFGFPAPPGSEHLYKVREHASSARGNSGLGLQGGKRGEWMARLGAPLARWRA